MKRILLFATLLTLASCGGNAREKRASTDKTETSAAVPDMHTAETSLDYLGTYTGTFPAADCPGIEMRLTLDGDGTYDQHMKYIDRDAAYDEKGSYTVAENLLTLTPADSEDPFYYKVEENRLRRLDMDKQPITGALAEHYVLKKTDQNSR